MSYYDKCSHWTSYAYVKILLREDEILMASLQEGKEEGG